jgi:hypothetical protein
LKFRTCWEVDVGLIRGLSDAHKVSKELSKCRKTAERAQKSSQDHTDLVLKLRILSEEQERSKSRKWELQKAAEFSPLPTTGSIAVWKRKRKFFYDVTRVCTRGYVEQRRRVCFSEVEVQLGYLQEAVVSGSSRTIGLSVSTQPRQFLVAKR